MSRQLETEFKLRSPYTDKEYQCLLEIDMATVKRKEVISVVRVMCLNDDDPEFPMYEPYATLNVRENSDNETFLFKDWSENAGIYEQLIEQGIIEAVTQRFGDTYKRVKIIAK